LPPRLLYTRIAVLNAATVSTFSTPVDYCVDALKPLEIGYAGGLTSVENARCSLAQALICSHFRL